MRILYAFLGILGGLLGLAFTYVFLVLLMFLGGAKGNMQHVILYVLAAFVIASILCLIAGAVRPSRPAARWLLTASAAVWIFCAVLLGVLGLSNPAGSADVIASLRLAGMVALPSLLPLAALYVAGRTEAAA
jgi:hypothetical protein